MSAPARVSPLEASGLTDWVVTHAHGALFLGAMGLAIIALFALSGWLGRTSRRYVADETMRQCRDQQHQKPDSK